MDDERLDRVPLPGLEGLREPKERCGHRGRCRAARLALDQPQRARPSRHDEVHLQSLRASTQAAMPVVGLPFDLVIVVVEIVCRRLALQRQGIEIVSEIAAEMGIVR